MRLLDRDERANLIEAERAAAQAAFDKSVVSLERNIHGQYSTPPALADSMVLLGKGLLPADVPVRFLDPALGTGVFFSSLLRVSEFKTADSAVGFELDPRLAAVSNRLWQPLGLDVRAEDFTSSPPPGEEAMRANLIVCNPPYVRHHHLSSELKQQLKRRVSLMGQGLSGLAGLYCYFLLIADAWLASEGVAVWIVPAEFLDVNYGGAIRQYLLRNVTTLQVHRFAPEDLQFNDALVTSVILVYKKSRPPANHRVKFTSGKDILSPEVCLEVEIDRLSSKEKWGLLFSSATKPAIGEGHATLGDFFYVKRGLATGANKFFILNEAEVNALQLPSEFLRPILPSQRSIEGDFVYADSEGFPKSLPRLMLLDCALPRHVVVKRYPSLDSYLRKGENEGIHERYLARSRSPWYSQERRPPAPIVCTYMSRRRADGASLRFIRNYSQATAANVFLLLYPRAMLGEAAATDPGLLDLLFNLLRTVPNIELSGRIYGGGLHKMEPRELSNFPIPDNIIDFLRSRETGKDFIVGQKALAFGA